MAAYPSAEDLVDGRRLLERALGNDLGPHLLHVEHEGVQRLLDVVHLVLLRAGLLRPAPAAPAAHSRGGRRRPLLSHSETHDAVAARRTGAEVGAGGVGPAAAVDNARGGGQKAAVAGKRAEETTDDVETLHKVMHDGGIQVR